MPDASGNPLPGELVRYGIDPFLYGTPGQGPLMLAGLDNFNRNVRPLIENQMTLAGLGNSGALGVATGDALAQVLPQFIMADYDNRFRAAQTLQGEEQLNQSAAQLAASISDQEMQRQLQAYGTAGNLILGLSDPFSQAATIQQQQQGIGLQGVGAAGELQQGVAQGTMDATEMERLRQQGLAEGSTIGLFSSVLPPTLQSKTKSSSGK